MRELPILPAPRRFWRSDGFFLLPEGGSLVPLLSRRIDPAIRGEESYRLAIRPNEVVLSASTQRGLFYAFQSLKQLVAASRGGKLPCLEIEDSPRFPVRAFMLDSARHRQPVETIKRVIDGAALLKMNVFHWHLSDDQGFRFESRKYPLLNRVGSFRDGEGFGSKRPGRYGGYYTREEMAEIIRYCHQKYIKVVPELDLPGHVSAILASYPSLSCHGRAIRVRGGNGIYPDILCPSRPEVLDWVKGLLDEIMEVFPDDEIHLGGDEVPKGQWYRCPDCLAHMRAQGMQNAEELQRAFTLSLCDYIQNRGRRAIVWNDSLKAGALPPQVTVQYWLGDKKAAAGHAAAGGNLILSELKYMYADYPFGLMPLGRTYRYEPSLPGALPENIRGVEMPVWTEFIRDDKTLFAHLFPRLAAVAEVGWSEKTQKSSADFLRRLNALLPQWERLGITAAPKKDWNGRSFSALRQTLRFLSQTSNRETVRRQVSNMKEARVHAKKQGFSL